MVQQIEFEGMYAILFEQLKLIELNGNNAAACI